MFQLNDCCLRISMINKWLLPYYFKFIGIIFSIIGVFFAVIRFVYDIKFSFFELKWFALYSQFFRKKNFSLMKTNLSEEIPLVFLLLGLMFWGMSKEKIETEEITDIRVSSLFISLYADMLLLVLIIMFTFGIGFIKSLMFYLLFFWICFLVVFYTRKYKKN